MEERGKREKREVESGWRERKEREEGGRVGEGGWEEYEHHRVGPAAGMQGEAKTIDGACETRRLVERMRAERERDEREGGMQGQWVGGRERRAKLCTY